MTTSHTANTGRRRRERPAWPRVAHRAPARSASPRRRRTRRAGSSIARRGDRYGAATTTGFLTVSNMKAILTAAPFVGIIAVGLTVIILERQPLLPRPRPDRRDLGDGLPLLAPWGLAAAILLTLLLGLAIGAVQGFAVGAWGANPIIITIGAAGLMEGMAVWLSHGQSIVPPADADQLGAPRASRPRPPRSRLRLPRRHGRRWRS